MVLALVRVLKEEVCWGSIERCSSLRIGEELKAGSEGELMLRRRVDLEGVS